MSPDYIPQFSLTTAALVVFAACAGFVILRGITRMIIGTAVLGASAWIGFRLWQEAPALSVAWTGKSMPWITTWMPVVAFVISLIVIRKIANLITRPFGNSKGNDKPRSLAGTMVRLVLALIPTSLISLIGATFLHHNGSIAEVRAFAEKSDGEKEKAPDDLSRRLKSSVESALPESWLKAMDPLADPSRLALAKLIAARAESAPPPVIDPQTGKPFPRAIIVDDPDLQNLARDGNFGTLLRHPLLTKALADPQVKQLLGGQKP